MNDTKQTSKAPAFSVIMPTYNRAFCIKTAIDSLLNQTYQQFELIIVDDGSTDRTEQLIQKSYQKYLKSAKFKYIKLKHVGVCAARNVGIKEAKNEWITYLDTDNYLLPNALGVYAYNIQKNFGQQNFYAKFISKTTKEIYGKLFNFEDIKKQNTIDLGIYLHTKKLIEKCGGFDETLKRYVDWEIIARHCAYSHPIFINEIVMQYNDSRKFQRITTSEPEAKSYSAAYNKIKNLKKDLFKKKIDKQNNLTLSKSCFFKIIIPNYNNMPFIKKCLDSILDQTFQNFKIIIVDDLSIDNSDKFCEMYSRKYPDKIIYIQTKKKVYAGGCRNIGIDYNLDAKYYYFIDGDDYLANNKALENLYHAVNKTFPELVLFKLTVKTILGKTITYNDKVTYKNFIRQKRSNILLSYWNSASSRIVRSDKIQYFLENCIYAEDTYQWMLLYDKCSTIKEIFDDIYVYQQHTNSSTYTTNETLKTKSKKIFIDALINYYSKTDNKKIQTSILGRLKTFDQSLQTYIDQKLNRLIMNKRYNIAVYTYCTNNRTGKQYQTVKYQDDNIDYYMFVDNKQPNEKTRNGWTVIQIDQKQGFAIEDMNKYYKWHPKLLPNYKKYDYIIYVDSKVEILANPNIIIESIKDNIPLGICCHKYNYRAPIIPDNYKCLYKHIDYLIAFPAGDVEKLKNWKNYLLSIKFPKNQEFAETAVLITDMHNPNGLKLADEIFDMYLHASTRRDQVVIPLVLSQKSYTLDKLCTLGKYTTYSDEVGSKFFKNNHLTNINRRN